MEYNSQKEELALPEYGRNVQDMIRLARDIESDAERQAFIEEVVVLMQQISPQNKNVEDYKDKLWKHVFVIAQFDLPGVVPPNGIIPTPEDARKKPEHMQYPFHGTQFRHYGNNVQKLIKSAIEMEPGPVRDGFVAVIGSYMKLAYRTWNKEHFVSDDMIKNDLVALSNGILSLDEDTAIDAFTGGKELQRKRPNLMLIPNKKDNKNRMMNKKRKKGN